MKPIQSLLRASMISVFMMSLVQSAGAGSDFRIEKAEDGLPLLQLPDPQMDQLFPAEDLKVRLQNGSFWTKPESAKKPVGPMRLLAKNELTPIQNKAISRLAETAVAKPGYQEAVEREFANYDKLSKKYPDRVPPMSRAEFIEKMGYKFGIEYGTWIAKTSSGALLQGKVVWSGNASMVSASDFIKDMKPVFASSLKQGERIVEIEIFHNHPRRSPLSSDDLQIGLMLKVFDQSLERVFSPDIKVDVFAVSLLSPGDWLSYEGSSLTDASQLPIDDMEQ